ncbi:DUF5667 domain-containing protein [Chloroflexota bacterium]
MKDELQQILEECLELLEQGTCIEDCLNKHPAQARELKSLLSMAQLSRKSLHYSISRDTKVRIHNKVMTQWDRQHRPQDQKKLILSWLPRWAYVAVSVVLFLLISGLGVNAAAADTTPGDSLYPIKRSFEEVQLVFTLSDMAKAEVHVRLAEHRIDEILKLAGKGESEDIPGLAAEVTANLEKSKQYASASKKDPMLFTNQLENSALGQLDKLEGIRPDIAEDEREVVDAALKTTGEAYGKAIETVTGDAPLATSEEVGKLKLYIGDRPPDQVDRMLVRIDGVEIYRPGLDKGWIAIYSEPILVDVIDIIGMRKLIVEKEIDTGPYTKLRINIAGITLVVGDETIEAYVPGQQLNIVRPFMVSEGKTTELLLDVDWKKSITISEENQHIVTPATLLLGPPDDKDKEPPDDKQTGSPDDKDTGPPDDKDTGPPADKDTGPPDDKDTGPPADKDTGPPDDKDTGPPADKDTGPPDDKQTGKPDDKDK